MQIEEILCSISELQARIARLAKIVEEIHSAVCPPEGGESGE
ncbi:MAG: hypothetical protein PHI19_05525 [Clostridia bacterium]|nr:hypothetical protein [Clostridia bacterium]